MLISHKYKFIFLKTTKTASTSIEVDLSKLMASNDVVTPIFPKVDGHEPRNYKYSDISFKINQPHNHMPAIGIRNFLGTNLFNEYFKFCVEREPLDKCISHYSMLKNSPDFNLNTAELTWQQYINRGIYPVDTKIYTDVDGTLIVNKILKYENLTQDILEVGDYLGIQNLTIKALAKFGFRENIVVTNEQRSIIYDAFEESNLYTGYKL